MMRSPGEQSSGLSRYKLPCAILSKSVRWVLTPGGLSDPLRPMKQITSVTHLTLSIGQALAASLSNRALGGVVTLAKGNEGTSIVVQRTHANRRDVHYRFGYARFGLGVIWCGSNKLPVLPLTHPAASGMILDEAICREIVNNVTDLANATAASRAGQLVA